MIQAILSADMIVVGPGSLYTSLLPNLLVNDVLAALRASKALKVFITNLVNQPGETETFTASDHIHTIEEVIGQDIFNIVVCNSWYDIKFGKDKRWVSVDTEIARDPRLYQADLADHDDPIHHDAIKLGKTLMDLFFERTGPLG